MTPPDASGAPDTPVPARGGARDATEGPILGALIQLALPVVVTNVFQTLYQLIDTFWVGRLGEEAVAAVSLSFPVLFLMVSVGGGMSIAGAILVAQNFGARAEEAVDHAAGQSLLVVGIISVVVSVAGFLLAEPAMLLYQPEPAVAEMAIGYLRISFLGMVAVFAYYVFQALLRGVGDVKTPMYVVGGTVVLNFFLDPILIMGLGPIPAMGVVGAAWATVGSQGLAGFVGLLILFSGRYGLHLRARHLIPDREVISTIIRLGVPSSIEQSTRAMGIVVMMVLVANFGTTIVASYGIGVRILSFVIIPAMGLSMATSTVVGQNVGAAKQNRAASAAKIGMAAGFVGLTVAGMAIFLVAGPLVEAFVPDEPDVIETGARFLRIMALSFGFFGVQMVMSGALAGAGNTIAAMALSIMAFWVFRFPLAWLLSMPLEFGPEGIWWGFPVSNILSGGLAVGWFLRGTWMRRVVDDEARLEQAVLEEAKVEEGMVEG
ncbi:MAG: MATE family efflux transporter [Gemmatimonadota bacterium]